LSIASAEKLRFFWGNIEKLPRLKQDFFLKIDSRNCLKKTMTLKPIYLHWRWSWLCWLLLTTSLVAQPRDIRFEHLTVEQGLSNFSINDIIQDHQGFLWIATEDGLNKYDGYEFKVYKADPADTNALPSSYIRYFYIDRANSLLVITGSHLCRYNPNTDGFDRFERFFPNADSLSNKQIKRIFEDRNGDYWIGTTTGLYRYQMKQHDLTLYRHDPDDEASISGDIIEVFCEDHFGNLWIGTSAGGVNRYDRKMDSFSRYRHDPNAGFGLSSDFIVSLMEDRRGVLWIGTTNGLNYYDRQTDQVVPWRGVSDEFRSMEKDVIFDIAEDSQGTLWIGSFHAGLWRYEPEANRFVSYRQDQNDPYSLLNNRVQAIYEDRSGVMWLGHYRSGISRYVRYQDQFWRRKMDDAVYAICQDRHGILWIGTNSSGLWQYNREGKLIAHYRHDSKNQESLDSDEVLSIREDRRGDLWIGTARGLHHYDARHNGFLRYQHELLDPTQPAEQYNVKAIWEDDSGEIWIGTMGSGLCRFDPQNKTFAYYRHDPQNPQSLSHNNVWAICEDPTSRDYIWIGTFGGGLNRFDKKNETFTHYAYDSQNPYSLSNDGIYSVYVDTSGIIWAGTFGGGLNRLDPATNRFTHYTDKDGLSDNFVKGILADAQGNLWLSTDKGLSRFNPKTGTFKNFTEKDGLISNVLLSGAYFKKADGRMYFAGEDGVIAFYPDSLRENTYLPPVAITSFKVFDRSILPGSASMSQQRQDDRSPPIVLSYRDNFFSIEFVALDYNEPSKNQYAYRLEGLDRDWNYCGTRRYASYTHIDPGEYTFRVKGSNNEGVWNEEGASIKIIITPPFWQRWWFRTAVVFFILASILTWHLNRIKRADQKKKVLELQVKERTEAAEALQKALSKVEQLKNRLHAENIYLQAEIKLEHNFTDIISRSSALQKILSKVEQVAATDATVLILGESGTGKELLARAVHNLSPRRDRPLVKVNCAALPANLIESELFGHEKGAFTGAIARKIGRFELANGGTIFLDEIGELPLELQAKLLRILQDGEFERVGGQQTLKVDTRVIAATNRDLKAEIQRRLFREDLYYRLYVFPITIPPLRDRKEDIPLLVNHFVKKYSARSGKKIESVSQHIIDTLQAYPWPGNVRELENVIERAVIVSQGKQLKLDDWLPQPFSELDEPTTLSLEDMERNHVIKVLEQTGWRISGEKGAARILNINASTLRSRMEKLGIKR
jgi:DNA-binding NtrC family response regulator/ligand-binding sensor domain-containing protein